MDTRRRRRARTVASILAAGRVVFSTALLVAPAAMARPFAGASADLPGVVHLNRSYAARDLVLGASVLAALRTGDGVRIVLAAAFVADACDAVLGVVALPALARRPALGAIAMSLGCTAADLYAWGGADG